MLTIRNEGIILEKTNLDFENQAVLNPGCVEVDGIVHMFYRAVHQGNFSTIGYCQLKDNKIIFRLDKPILFPEFDYEKQGLEDPRIVKHEDGNYYLFYTAYDGVTAHAAYAISTDLKTFTKKGLIAPSFTFEHIRHYLKDIPLRQKYMLHALRGRRNAGENAALWEKDAFIFPKKIAGKYALVHRILPSIQLAYFDSFDDMTDPAKWEPFFEDFKKYTILDPRIGDDYVGGGCPPIETQDGWLFIYHRVMGKRNERIYCAGAALLKYDEPTKVLAKLKAPLFYPHETWEMSGDVNNVVFPTGTIEKDGRLFVYYGAADTHVAATSFMIDDLLTALKDPTLAELDLK
jgi:predicted GH43/DUF377 family glycosyl hydrolase